MKFAEWLDTFVDEKGFDRMHHFEVTGPVWGVNFIPLECVIEQAKAADPDVQEAIKIVLVGIDFRNGNVMRWFEELAAVMAL